MPDLSLPAANLFSNAGNAALFLGAFLVLLGTWLTIWSGGQKERYADERISTNEKLTATANADAAKAIKETEKIRGDNLRLTTDLERERAARARIEAGLASRTVQGATRDNLVASLRGLSFKPNVQLTRLVGDAEARTFGEELAQALRQSGFTVAETTIGMAPGFPDGLSISSPSAEFVEAFRSLATSAFRSPDGSQTTVSVGLKPPSF